MHAFSPNTWNAFAWPHTQRISRGVDHTVGASLCSSSRDERSRSGQLVSAVTSSVAGMQPLDLAGMFLTAFLAVPGQLFQMVASNPQPWIVVGLGFLALLVVAYVKRRARGRRHAR